MPVATETLYNTRRVTVIFAVSSAIMTLAMLWLVLVDYNRPWKSHQTSFMDNEAVLAELTYLTTQQNDYQQRLEEAQQRVEACRRDIDISQNQDYAQLISELDAGKQELYGLDLDFKQKDALIVVARSQYEEALALHGSEDTHTQQAWDNLRTMEQASLEAKVAKDAVEDRVVALDKRRREVEQPFSEASRELTVLQKQIDEARGRRDRFSSQLYRKGLNVPLLDFAAPGGTPGGFEVRQIVAQGVKTKLNFLEGYKVDRCTTCHLVIDNKNFALDSLVGQFEQFIPAILEHLAERGDARAPVISMPQPPVVFGYSEEQLFGNVAQHWGRVEPTAGEAYFRALQDEINRFLAYADLPLLDLDQPLRAHPHLDLYLSDDSPHPVKEMGCTVCHEGNGQETDFVLAAHTPKNKRERAEWSEKYYDRNLGVPTMTWHTLEHFWDFPMIPPTYSEASCAKCHYEIDDLGRFETETHGQKLREGKKLFTQLGCINCHLVQTLEDSRRVGTDLAHVGAKVGEGFLQQWIFNPKEFRPSTRMPHFFMQENNGPGSESSWDPDPALRTRTETVAISDYLRYVSTPWQPEPLPEGLSGDVESGRGLFGGVGCLGCHGNIAEYGERWATDDLAQRLAVEDRAAIAGDFESKLRDISRQIDRRAELDLEEDEVEALHRRYAQLVEQRNAAPQRTAEDFYEQAAARVADMDLNELTHYAVEHFGEARRRDAEARASEEQLNASLERRDPDPLMTYLPPVFTRFAPDLSGIGTKVGVPWLYGWLRNPQHYSSYTKMPSLRLTEQEGLDVATYLATLKHDTFRPETVPRSAEVLAELDRRMDDILSGQNSQATIDRIKGDEGQILTELLEDQMGALRPGLGVTDKKMLFVGRKMIAHYGCFACHEISGFENAARPGTELTEWGEKNIHQLDFAFFSKAYEETLHHTERFEHLHLESRPELLKWHGLHENPEIEVGHTHASFATHKMLNPRIWDRDKVKKPYEKLKMPNFYLTDGEVEAVVTFMLSRRPPRVAETLTIDYENEHPGPIAAGRTLVDELNCTGCHKVEDNYATIHQFISVAAAAEEEDEGWDDWGDDEEEEEDGEDEGDGADDEEEEEVAEEEEDAGPTKLGDDYGGEYDLVNGPPWLRGEGAKLQPDWFHSFLLNVETLRPWKELEVRMPSFYLTSEQAGTLVDYFAALARDESEDLQRRLDRVAQVTAKAPDPDSARQDWYEQPGLSKDVDFLRNYAVEKELMLARNFDFKDREQMQGVYADVLNNAAFFGHLYGIRYPFEFSDFQTMDPQRFARGEELFQELKCLSCHVLGDPQIPGSNPNPSAPNLNLTHQRLRYEWFHQWLQEPAKIQPGTKMPQWFPHGNSAYAEYSADLRGPFENAFGATGAEQMKLLLDYVWQAGQLNITAVEEQPATTPEATAATPQAPAASQEAPAVSARPPAAVREQPAGPALISTPIRGPIGPGGAIADTATGTIRGRVTLGGERPAVDHVPVAARHQALCGTAPRPVGPLAIDESGGVQDCVVYLAAAPQLPEATDLDPAAVPLQNCRFERAVSLVAPGGGLRFVNQDDTTHNLQARMGDTLLWSKNLAGEASQATFSPDKPGIVTIRSSGLDWMTHHVWVVDHAAYARTAAGGGFSLAEIPSGEYTLHVWHPGWHMSTAPGGDGAMIGTVPVVVGGSVRVTAGQTTDLIIQLTENEEPD